MNSKTTPSHGDNPAEAPLSGSDDTIIESQPGRAAQAFISDQKDQASAKSTQPETIGNYQITSELGRGGMGIVYLAKHQTLDRQVAVKVLNEREGSSPELAERFLREAQLAAKLPGDHVVHVLDVGVDQSKNSANSGRLYLVQEYVTGGSVADLMNKQSSENSAEAAISEARCLAIVRDVASALVSAEQFGIIHRDIKPENILLTSSGTAKLTDFGLAKALDDKSGGLTESNATLGTPRYMSPEQIRDVSKVDHRTDLYSLGATLFHMLTGQPPFAGHSIFNIMNAVIHTDVRPPKSINPKLSKFASDLCMKLLEKDPDKRLQSASDIIASINQRQIIDSSSEKNSQTLVVIAMIAVLLIAALQQMLSQSQTETNLSDVIYQFSDPDHSSHSGLSIEPSYPEGTLITTGEDTYISLKNTPITFSLKPEQKVSQLKFRVRADKSQNNGVFVIADLGAEQPGRGFLVSLFRNETKISHWDELQIPSGIAIGCWQVDVLFKVEPIFDGNWHTIQVNRSDSEVQVKVDEEDLDGQTVAIENAVIQPLATDGAIAIGAMHGDDASGYLGQFTGDLDDIEIR